MTGLQIYEATAVKKAHSKNCFFDRQPCFSFVYRIFDPALSICERLTVVYSFLASFLTI